MQVLYAGVFAHKINLGVYYYPLCRVRRYLNTYPIWCNHQYSFDAFNPQRRYKQDSDSYKASANELSELTVIVWASVARWRPRLIWLSLLWVNMLVTPAGLQLAETDHLSSVLYITSATPHILSLFCMITLFRLFLWISIWKCVMMNFNLLSNEDYYSK